jgi:predicted RNase H-like HicB family nuclease
MRKPAMQVTIVKEDTGYSAYSEMEDKSIHTEGETFDELKANILEAVNLAFEEEGIFYSIEEIRFKPLIRIS